MSVGNAKIAMEKRKSVMSECEIYADVHGMAQPKGKKEGDQMILRTPKPELSQNHETNINRSLLISLFSISGLFLLSWISFRCLPIRYSEWIFE
jgi:hypothetical protein